MIRYIFREDAAAPIKNAKKADPQKIGEELTRIAESGGGRLTPRSVVKAAENPRSVLHKHFEWDDAKAANAFRLDQARGIIRVVQVEDEDADPQRAFLSVSDGKGVSYRTAAEVANSRDLQYAVLRQAERDLLAFETRYRELSDVCDLVRPARERVSQRMQGAQAA